jgi:hypothetical protein
MEMVRSATRRNYDELKRGRLYYVLSISVKKIINDSGDFLRGDA